MEATGHCVGKQAKHRLGRDSWWTVEVDVYLEAAGDPPKFWLETCLPINKLNDKREIVFHNRGRHGFEILFTLHDLTGSGYRFPGPPHLKEALWSRSGEGCPPKNHNEQWDEFRTVRLMNSGMTLAVRNLNETITRFGYTLRVTNDDGASYVELDPGGDNQNGAYDFNYF
jgi:hypothetical protein